jgi:hypothetical protein
LSFRKSSPSRMAAEEARQAASKHSSANWRALPHHPYQVLPSEDHVRKCALVNQAYAEALQACRNDPYLSAKLQVVQDPRSPFHWFIHFRNLSAAPFDLFKSGIYGHIQFCSVGRMDKTKNRPFLVKQPAVGILTPTAIFTSYKRDGSLSTGAKDIGIPGVCGTAYADEHIYRMAMNDVFNDHPLQTGVTYTWNSEASVTAQEDVLEVANSGGEYGRYLCPILRYRSSITTWLAQLVMLLDLNMSPRGPLAGSRFDGIKAFKYRFVCRPLEYKAISDAADASVHWAQSAYCGQLLALFESVYAVPPPLNRAPPTAPSPVLRADRRWPLWNFEVGDGPSYDERGPCDNADSAESQLAARRQRWIEIRIEKHDEAQAAAEAAAAEAAAAEAAAAEAAAAEAAAAEAAGASTAAEEAQARAAVAIPMVVIGDAVGEDSEIPIGELVQVNDATASAAADATVELSYRYTRACAAVKVDPDAAATQLGAHGSIRRGFTGCAPRALAVLPVLEAEGVLQSVRQAPCRRARDAVAVQASSTGQQPAGQPRSRRQRTLEASPAISLQCGQRVSCVFEHDGAATVFHGAVTSVNTEFRNCEVLFDDGRSHRVAIARLTALEPFSYE